MVDMSAFIIAKSDQLNADDLMDSPKTITITKVTAAPDATEQPVSLHYEGENSRPFKPCKTVRRILVSVWGKDASKYIGRSMTLYRDGKVQFGGLQVGGIRVSHMSHIDSEKTVALLVTKGRKAPFTIKPLATTPQPANEQALALQAITDAAGQGTEALANTWKQKWMAPHRDALQLDLERLKAVAAANDQPNAGTGDETDDDTNALAGEQSPDPSPAEDAVNKVIAEAEAAKTEGALNKIIADADKHKPFLDDDLQVKLEIAFDKARQRLAVKEPVG